MPDRSASDRAPRWYVPRWVFIAWLWVIVLGSFFEEVGCEWTGHFELCVRGGNFLGWFLALFPEPIGIAMVRFTASPFLIAAPVALAATGMTWLALRFLPARLALGRAVLLTLAWYLLSAPLMFLALWIVVSH